MAIACLKILYSQRQNEQRCEQEIVDIERGIKSGNITPDASLIRFSDDALDEQKHCIRIADEKVALAAQAYDLVNDITTLTLSITSIVLYVIELPSCREIKLTSIWIYFST